MRQKKAYSDLEQSKKLAELLPAESADMEYMFLKKDNSLISRVPFVKDGTEEPNGPYNFIPCWSLEALLGALFNLLGEPLDNLVDASFKMIITIKERRTK